MTGGAVVNVRSELEARLGAPGHIRLNDIDLDPARIRAVLINEVVPADPAQDFYGSGDGAYAASALPLFRQAGVAAETMTALVEMGVYVTNAVKTPKDGYAVSPECMAESLPWLEAELALFPNVQVILLMGDVAKKMYNRIARKTLKKNVIPSGATYRIRDGQYFNGRVCVMPSYIMTGGNLLIEKSKTAMIVQDLARMKELIR